MSSSHVLSAFKPLLMKVDGSLSEDKVIDTVGLGLHCTETEPVHRPTLETVLKILNDEVDCAPCLHFSYLKRTPLTTLC